MKKAFKPVIIFIGLALLVCGIRYASEQSEIMEKEKAIEKAKKNELLTKEQDKFYKNCLREGKTENCCNTSSMNYREYIEHGYVSSETKDLVAMACIGAVVKKESSSERGIIDDVKTGVGLSIGHHIVKGILK